tara:strand:+ start:600 stop:1694 length:1095 start_codon:yes stop_codon:yes gene_type:complete
MNRIVYCFIVLSIALTHSIDDSRETAITHAVREVTPSVVGINVTQIRKENYIDPFMDPFWGGFYPYTRSFEVENLGSGVIISDDGYVITNTHVVENSLEIIVTLSGGQRYNAELVGYDELTDVALLKIDSSDLPFAILGDSDKLIIGEWVIAFGNPLGLFDVSNQPTATAGIVSGINVDFGIKDGGRVYQNMIQTDASINPGNSGGPLTNSKGEVIGINTFIMTGDNYSRGSIGIGFSIPINSVKEIVSDIKRYGKVKRSYSTGLHVQPIDPTIQKYLRIPIDRGVIVTDVEKNSSADKAGIRIRDVIYAVDNKYISSARDIKEIIKEGLNKSGDFISLSIYRGEDKINLQLQLEEPKDNWPGY